MTTSLTQGVFVIIYPSKLSTFNNVIQFFNPSITPLTYFTNPTGLVVNGSFTVVNTSNSSVFNVNYTTGVTLSTVVVTAGRSETIFVEDLRTITIESLTGATPEANATGSLVLDLHYCVKCS
jgi:hypothetical protein